MYLRRPSSEDGPKGPPLARTASQWALDHPALWEFLSSSVWPDGEGRETGTLLVFFEEGFIKARVCDRACNRHVFMSALSLEVLLTAIEDGLRSGEMEWRPVRPYKGRK